MPPKDPINPSDEALAKDYRRYLDPRTLAKIANLDLRARLVVEGYISGMHRSPYRGYSIEFAQHRHYVQGDDIRHIDWKVFARTNKYYIKQYEEETNLVCLLGVDCSESMAFRSSEAPMSKHDYAVSIAAALSYLALRQQDSVGLATFDDGITRFIRPTNNPAQWKVVIHELEGSTGPSKTSLRKVLDELSERLKRRTLIVLISDFFDDLENIRQGLRYLRYHRNEVILCQVLDPAELEFPLKGPTLFRGMEKLGTLLAEPRTLRERYLEEMQRFTAQLRRLCRELKLDYVLFNTRDPLDVALSTYLATRGATMR
ncbi:MAG: hypothetical protein HJJLKODD_01779 [Phycisphaerae bacterium]|nr:hypothetical protein [Phycisphaerae bacterium]